MAASEAIPRHRTDPFGLDFDTLRTEGLALVQGLSGASWTDYNPHDPGVTILEQLCYALTELAYRSGFSMQDYLASNNGSIDFEGLALFRPEAIFPSQAVTLNDYCKLLFAAIPELDDVRLIPRLDAEQRPQGLYNVSVKLYEALDQEPPTDELRAAIQQKIRAIYAQHRSLCEDLVDVTFVKTQPCYLCGEIEIQGNRPAAEIYAEIFFACARKISSNIRIQRYEDVMAQGMSREQMFTGPLIRQGYISDGDFDETRSTPTIAELVALVTRIDGVKQVHSLDLVNENGTSISDQLSCDLASVALPSLRFPENTRHLHWLNLVFQSNRQSGRALSQDQQSESDIKARLLLEAAKLQLQKREFEYRAFRRNDQAVSQFLSMPSGERWDLSAYVSIQEQFPAIYGINRAGIPRSAAQDVKARAKQLKAYLFPFEQLMANYLQTLQQLPQLFSLDPQLRQSYFSQYLGDEELPNIEEIYISQDRVALQRLVAQIQARYDNYVDRRNRVLDVMLAMYGERFEQEALQRFNYYRQADTGQWVIENKIHYLKNLTEISCHRAQAFNPQQPPGPSNLGAWQKKIGILLGIKNYAQQRSLAAVFSERQIQLLSDDEYHQLAKARALEPDAATTSVPLLNEAHPGAHLALALKNCVLSESMLRLGFDLSHYKLVHGDAETTLYFQAHPAKPLYRLAALPQQNDAVVSARQFRNALVELNQESEGLHVIEHLLLRHYRSAIDPDFHPFQLSVILPGWTARFADVDFRKLAEETICRQLPSHIYAHVYWLDFASLQKFEALQSAWLSALAAAETDDNPDLLSAVAALESFLRQQPKQPTMYWV